MTASGDADIESLRKRTYRPLDVFLLVSIIFLFLAMSAVVAAVVIAVKRPECFDLQGKGASGQTAFKMENFVYLDAKSSDLMNSTMPWEVVDYGEGTSKGSLFEFNQKQNALQTKQAGMYFIYVVLNLTCTHRDNCTPGRLHVQVGDKLTCEVELQSEPRVTKKCWTVSKVEREKLLTQMTVPKTGLTNWKLELKGSGLGMFLVD
ncbi:hypothetical protein fugu_007753 [Takifugu bimaculatus]|uniref:TNF family profile domain-containing protein n=1 Tax=Takifugu bimaculatus TaxID=433685 RepID=A0A4Z2AZA3_9TELE|nr:hypothetical protein fugu_007753 [Takifugu bimaculatus]